MANPIDIDTLTESALKALVIELLTKVAELEKTVAEQRDEIARLKGLKPRPKIKPSGMEKASAARSSDVKAQRRRRGKKKTTRDVDEQRIIKAEGVPGGSRFKGYESFVVQELVLRPQVTRYLRERWVTPDGRTIIAPVPQWVKGSFGPELRRFVLFQYHRCQVTVPRIVEQLHAAGFEISQRQVMRILIEDNASFINESTDVLRAGLTHAKWISADDTGARHKAANQYCTQIGNDHFTWFGTTKSKSRLNFLELLRGGYNDYVINDKALAYMRQRKLSGAVISLLAEHKDKRFADETSWTDHLKKLGIDKLKVHPDPVRIASEGAAWGAILEHGFLSDAVILSDDAGQFNVGLHALCWVHAERLIHKLEAFSEHNRKAKELVRRRIWLLYDLLRAYREKPSPAARTKLTTLFDRIFKMATGFNLLDRLLKRLFRNKKELLMVLDRPEVPLNTNMSENDIRDQVTKRKVSGGTRSDEGRDCRNAFLSLGKTCAKLKISFWDYLGSRLGAAVKEVVPYLAEIVAQRCAASG